MADKPLDLSVKCNICNETYANKNSFYSHRYKKHGGAIRETIKCPIAGCGLKFTMMKKMNAHVKKEHKDKVVQPEETKEIFESDEEFKLWLYDLQQRTSAQFVLQRSGRDLGDRTSYRFYCNRSGVKDKRHAKKNGPQSTAKIDAHCTAHFTATVYIDGKVKIEGSLHHAGHELELNKLRMPPEIIERIERYLSKGWPPQTILQKIQDESDVNSREHYIKKKDISYYLKSRMPELVYRFDERDERSVAAMVEYYSETEEEDSPFFYFQPKTTDNNSFSIGIQTPEMHKMLERFGGGVVCTDTSHGTTQYPDLLFGTILVVDDSGGGQPAAFFFVRSESRDELTPIFKALQRKHPTLKPEFFMSDYSNALWNSWHDAFGSQSPDTRRLLCDFHIWRCWLKNLNSKVSSNEQRVQLRQALSLLQHSHDREEFDFRWSVFVERLMRHQSLTEFGDYFKEMYGGMMVTTWAKYSRSLCEVGTNMHLEAMHRVVKYKFLERQCNRRLDYTCGVLINKVAPYYTHAYNEATVMKRVSSHRQHLASSEHLKSRHYIDNPEHLEVVSEDKWRIRSESTENCFYYIRRVADFDGEKHHCLMACRYCSVCCHAFRCDCPRNKRSGHVACKHIHSLQVLFGCQSPPRRHDDVTDLLADQASVLVDDVPAAPATDDALFSPPTTDFCIDASEIPTVDDADLPSSFKENNDAASSNIQASIGSSIVLLQQRLDKLDKFAQSNEAAEDQLKIAHQQLQHCSRVIKAIPLSARRAVLSFGRRSRKRVIERQPRSFREASIKKAKERLRSDQLLPLPRKKVKIMEKRAARWVERDQARDRLKDMLNVCREMNI